MSKFMLFLGAEFLYFLYIWCFTNALSVPSARGNRTPPTNGDGHLINPTHLLARRSALKIVPNRSYRTYFESYPTIDKIGRSDEYQSGNVLDDNIDDSLQQNNHTNSTLVVLKYELQSPANSPLYIDSGSYSSGSDSDSSENEKVELHTNNHQSLNNPLSRHYSSYLSSNLNNGPNSLHYSSASNNKYGFSHHSNSNSLANSLSLNYIHSLLLSKPQSASNSLSHLLNFNSNSLSLTTSPYGLPMQNGYVSSYNSASNTNNIHPIVPMKQPSGSSASPATVASLAIQSSNIESMNLNTIDPPIDTLSCGKQQVSAREPRIVGGNGTYEGEFPWAVSIQRQGNHHCGGVIVGKRWILTAAHCVRSQLVGNLIVRTGGHTLTRSINSINSHLSRDYLVDQIVVHDDFSRYDNLTASQMKSSANTNNADIALLRLKNDIMWNELAWPVCFPSIESGNFSGHDATVIGWGKLNEKSEDFSNELQKVKLTIIDNKVCQNWFRQAGRDMPIDDRIICAGFKNGGKDACHGDSGGPLLSKINGHYTVVGVVSTGIGCARPLLPGLYSRVSSYIRWIEKYVN